jgi:hypothetical protein
MEAVFIFYICPFGIHYGLLEYITVWSVCISRPFRYPCCKDVYGPFDNLVVHCCLFALVSMFPLLPLPLGINSCHKTHVLLLHENISRSFGNFVAIWYILPCVGTLCQEKSGNPVRRVETFFIGSCQRMIEKCFESTYLWI